jgi:hypothetical protein
MNTELTDIFTALLILLFVIGRGFCLLKEWCRLNAATVIEKLPEQQATSQQALTPASDNAVYVVIPKNLTGARYEDYKAGIRKAV